MFFLQFFLKEKPKEKDDDEKDNLAVGDKFPPFTSDHLISFPRDFSRPANSTGPSSHLKRMPAGASQAPVALEIRFQ